MPFLNLENNMGATANDLDEEYNKVVDQAVGVISDLVPIDSKAVEIENPHDLYTMSEAVMNVGSRGLKQCYFHFFSNWFSLQNICFSPFKALAFDAASVAMAFELVLHVMLLAFRIKRASSILVLPFR